MISTVIAHDDVRCVETLSMMLQENGKDVIVIVLMKPADNPEGMTLQKVAVPTSDGYELLNWCDILYCEAADNYTHIHLKNRIKIIACRTLKQTEEQMQHLKRFVRVHHSYLVNLDEVTKYVRGDGGHLVLTNGATISVARSRKQALIDLF